MTTTPMILPRPVLKLEDLNCATCVFSRDMEEDNEDGLITCIRARDAISNYPYDFYCGEGGWFVGGMDLIHNMIQAIQHFYIKDKIERKEDESRGVEIPTVDTKTPF